MLPSFAEREELAIAYNDTHQRGGLALQRAFCAALGLCTRIGRECGTTYHQHKYDALGYGGAVYGWLREQGATPKQIAEAGLPCIIACCEALAPRQPEVADKVVFSGPPGGD